MRKSAVARLLWVCMLVLTTVAPPAWAQITTSTVTGIIKDQQGGVMPGATVTLISETKGTQSPSVVTNDVGSFVVTNVTGDTYTVQVEMPSFKTLKRSGLQVSAGSQVTVPPLTLEIGGAAEVITVTSEAPIIQASSGERSFAVTSEQVESLPASTRAFIQYTVLAPGVENNGLQRIGGGGQSNVMMDGVSTMDTGNNGLMLQLTNESIAEVKMVSSSYQAEYGRSSGLQISVVTKSGTNQFRGGLYDIERNSAWNSNSKTNILNGDPKVASRQRDWGYSIGGPIGRPGADNKLFFFYTQEYSPRTAGNDVVRFRVPTLLERAGDFSQTYDNNGALYPYIKDPLLPNLVCTAANTAGCFADGGVLGRIPANRLYQTGLNILKMWPAPNVAPGLPYNLQITRPEEKALSWQPVVRVDYQPMAKLRATFKATGWAQTNQIFNGSIPGFNDTQQIHPVVTRYAITANFTLTPSLVVEATWGRSQNERAGCSPGGNQVGPVFCTSGIPMNPIGNVKNAGLSDLPSLFPTSTLIDDRYYAYNALSNMDSPVFENGRMMRPPNFAFGSRVANQPPSIPYPNFVNINTTADLAVSVTKVSGSHTMKAGFYRYHSYKAENQRNNAFGVLSFQNDAVGTNPFDTSFGFANAAIGSFSSYMQSSRYIEGQWNYYNTEGYLQDNWRLNGQMTLDVGLRLVNQQPLRDQLFQESNFFLDKWSKSAAPRLYVPGCANGVYPCSGTTRQAMDPVTGQFLGPLSATAIGALVPNTGNALNGLLQTGPSGALGDTGYTYPAIGVEPRLGFAYNVGGQQELVFRGSGGLFFDRPSTSAYNQVNNPPIAQNVTVRFGELQNLSGNNLTTVGAPNLLVIKYDSGLPSSAQWSGGAQMRLPWSLALDAAYVGQRAWHQASQPDLNTVDIGAAFLPQNQDRTLAANTTPGATALSTDLLRSITGYGAIAVRADTLERTYHSLQLTLQRRMRRGLSFGFTDTISLSDRQNTLPRYQHDASGNVSIRSDQAEADKLLGSSLTPLHTMRANLIWQLPTLSSGSSARKVVAAVVNDWQLASIWSGITGTPYSATFAYQNGNSAVNLTGSPDFPARVRLVGEAGAGCSNDIYRQFNVAAFQGPLTGSAGLESSNDYLTGCFQSTLDVSLSRTIRFGGSRTLQLRMDVFNLPNSGIITARNTTMNLTGMSDPVTITNLPYDASGALVPARSRPAASGFGMATLFQTPRSVQFQVRVGF